MRVIIFGPTGGVGQALVAQALDRGLEVTAFARTPSKLTVSHPRLTVVQGDVLDAAGVARATAGHDAVLVALGGSSLLRDDTNCSEGTRHILAAMNAQGVKRLVVCSSMGVGDSRQHIPAFVRLMLTKPLKDKEIQEALIKASPTDWVIVRPTGLNNAAARGSLAIVEAGPVPTNNISRADVATFMLDQLQHNTWLKKTPGISWR